jgi:hypothetical protein
MSDDTPVDLILRYRFLELGEPAGERQLQLRLCERTTESRLSEHDRCPADLHGANLSTGAAVFPHHPRSVRNPAAAPIELPEAADPRCDNA